MEKETLTLNVKKSIVWDATKLVHFCTVPKAIISTNYFIIKLMILGLKYSVLRIKKIRKTHF